MDSGSHWEHHDDADAWERPTAGLGLLLHSLRARVTLWLAVAIGTVAYGMHPGVRWVAPGAAVIGALLGLVTLYALMRHLSHPARGGRMFGVLALLVVLGAVAIETAVLFGVSEHVPPFRDPLGLVITGELVMLFALAPLCGSYAGLAARLGASDLRRRSRRAAWLVLAAVALVAVLAYVRLALNQPLVATTLAAVSAVLVVLATAKVLGATRFLYAYLRTMHSARSSHSPLELSAWHQA